MGETFLSLLFRLMRSRPNAPFKPPRPFCGSSIPRKSEDSNSNSSRRVQTRVEAQISRVSSPDSSQYEVTNTSTSAQQAHTKRLKVEIVKPVSIETLKGTATSITSQLLANNKAFDVESNKAYYTVQWRKKSIKKNKSWEGDGYIVVTDDLVVLKIQAKDGSYKPVGRSKKGSVEGLIVFGSYEAEVDSEATLDEIQRLKRGDIYPVTSSVDFENQNRVVTIPMKKHNALRIEKKVLEDVEEEKKEASPDLLTPDFIDATCLELFTLPTTGEKPILVDTNLLQKLRPHQKEAVTFIYECLAGIRDPDYLGALLADEMGLGKTLTAITVIWTLLKQSPHPNQPLPLKKVLICCPVTLIDNWRREFSKWLDINKIGILALNNKQQNAIKEKQNIVAFGKTKVYQVLIMSYEKVLSCSKELESANLDLVVCDEGHRLKSPANKTLNVLEALNIPRKLILTGTPIQNDLNEYYTIINFVNPGVLGTYAEFLKAFLKPILKARDKGCVLKELLQEGKKKSQELINVTKSFVLRRTMDSVENFLSNKTDVLVFCKPSELQLRLFQLATSSKRFNSLFSETTAVLSMINVFRKICNLPSLLTEDLMYQQLFAHSSVQPEDLAPSALTKRLTGGKIKVLIPLLLEFKKAGEKTVLVSNFTQTLDLLQLVLSKLNLLFVRLDGSTMSNTRDQLVTKFNNSPQYDVFLLSAKAGGVGLNLVGASRLVLFDNDWNPLVDQQALARIHRDGQKKPVFIYRLFTAGCIDEKIFQRQLTKITLSDMFLDDHSDSSLNIFDYEDLRDLFSVYETECNTHELLMCECNGDGTNLGNLEQDEEEEEGNVTVHDEEGNQLSSGFSSALNVMDEMSKPSVKVSAVRTALINYRHFHPRSDMSVIEDDVLNQILHRMDGDITYCLIHSRRSDSF